MRNIIENVSWLAMGRVIRIAFGATIGVWVARYLGPADFGRINYVVAFVSLFLVVVPLGLPSVMVKEMVEDPPRRQKVLAVALVLQSLTAALAYLAAIAVMWMSQTDDRALVLMTALYAASGLSKPANAFRTWFEAEVRSKYLVWVDFIILLVFAAAKVLAILLNGGIWAILLIQTLETTASNIGVAIAYRRVTKGRVGLAWDRGEARHLMAQSWPLIISAVGLILYLRIDQVMLGTLSTESEVGIYSAALRLSEVWYTLPVILVGTLFPAIVRAREKGPAVYNARILMLLEMLIGASVLIAVGVTLAAQPLVDLLYGPAYAGVGAVLSMHIWAAIFIFIGTVTGKWYLLEGIRHLNITRNFLGAGANVALNFWAIPAYGAWGAAVATLISYIIANYLADLLSARARPLFWQKTRAFLLWPRMLWKPRQRLAQLRGKGTPR